MNASRSGVHGVLMRIGLAGYPLPRSRVVAALSRRAAEAVALLTHRHARRLTWRQRVVLQGRVRGLTTDAIAAELGIQPASVGGLVATARRRLDRPWRRRSRARRSPPADLAALLAALEAG
jgi:FixJ family two-component response regulator